MCRQARPQSMALDKVKLKDIQTTYSSSNTVTVPDFFTGWFFFSPGEFNTTNLRADARVGSPPYEPTGVAMVATTSLNKLELSDDL